MHITDADLQFGRYIIYGLRDTRPERDGELRYIGRSSSGLRRPRSHLRHDLATVTPLGE